MRLVAALALFAGCAVSPETSTQIDDVDSENGLGRNGVGLNGVGLNGVGLNGLDLGLATKDFASWFAGDAATHAMQMKYIVRCAKPEGTTIAWTDPASSTSYAWEGSLGLAADWVDRPMTLAEQQVLTACLLAHANKYGVHVPIALGGQTAAGAPIERAPRELKDFSVKEGAFFGNTVNGEGAFVCLDHAAWAHDRSSARACAFTPKESGTDEACAPIYQVGDCKKLCMLDAKGAYYTSCTFNGVAYRPITTRLLAESLYRCGDGVCQFTERCGAGNTPDSCKADCGLCP